MQDAARAVHHGADVAGKGSANSAQANQNQQVPTAPTGGPVPSNAPRAFSPPPMSFQPLQRPGPGQGRPAPGTPPAYSNHFYGHAANVTVCLGNPGVYDVDLNTSFSIPGSFGKGGQRQNGNPNNSN